MHLKKNRDACLRFPEGLMAAGYNVLPKVETKKEPLGLNERRYVWGEEGAAFQCTKLT